MKSLIGGLRPRWLWARISLMLKRYRRRTTPTIYMFVGRSQELIARRLVRSGKVNLIVDRLGIDGADAIRFDHIVAFPKTAEIIDAWHLLRALKRRHTEARHHERRYFYSGIDYGSILFGIIYRLFKDQIWAFVVVLAQTRRLQALTKPSAVFVNGATNEPMGISIAQNESTGRKVYLMPHGLNMQRNAHFSPAADNPHVTYLAYGSDHADYYQSWAGTTPNQPSILTGNPLTVSMNEIREKGRDPVHGNRLLILSYGHLEFWNAARTFAVDRYYAEIFSRLPALAEDGWTFNMRTHPTVSHSFEEWMALKLGVKDIINWKQHATLDEALQAHDAVVCSLSSACYQALYAGWPTIVYEPDYRNTGGIEGVETDPMLTGLLTAQDLKRPVTNDPDELVRMILDTLNPDSMVSRFPGRFADELAPRFIGPDPERADAIIADFLERDLLDQTPSLPGQAKVDAA